MCLHPGGAFPSLGCVMAMQTVLMATMSGRTAPGGLALETISSVMMDSVFLTHTGELGIKNFPQNLKHQWARADLSLGMVALVDYENVYRISGI